VWWAGAKAFQLYIGQRLSLLQAPGGQVLRIAHPPTLPLQAVLKQLEAAAQTQAMNLQRSKLQVLLHAGLCPGLTQEASQPSALLDSLTLQRDSHHSPPGFSPLSASIHTGLLDVLQSWSQSLQARLHNVQPLWAAATAASALQPAHIKALCVVEPGYVSLVANGCAEHPQGLWQSLPCADQPAALQSIQAWRLQYRFNAQEAMAIAFEEAGGTQALPGLAFWKGHWQLL
jgi:hypothetical protein